MSRCQVTLEKSSKTNFCVWEKGLPKPPPRTEPEFSGSHTWRNAKLSRQDAKSGCQNETPEWGRGGGKFRHFSNNSTTEQYFQMLLLSHEGVHSFSSPYCSGKLCSSPFYVPGRGKMAPYIVRQSL
jgi:hypothetical protein